MNAPAPARYTLQDGRLHCDGRPWFSVGVDYHPSAAGCQYWREWDPQRLDADFAAMAAHGCNTVRFFLFWADFEPEPGQYDQELTSRLREFAELAARHGLRCLPSLLTIWMNGQRFEPNWRAGRDLWRDPEMLERQLGFVRHIAGALSDAGDILAYDLGDEVIHVDQAASAALSPEQAQAWWSALAEAIREAHPGALVMQANEASAVVGTHAFRPEHAEPLDLVGLHGFPVWTPFHIESVSSAKAGTFVPYLVRRGLAHKPVLVDELGSYGCDEATAADYLRVTAHSALAAGACGVVVWCWQDFTTERKPYALRPNERFVGLLRADGTPKPAMTEFRAFAELATGGLAGFRPLPAPVGVHLLEQAADTGAGYLAGAGADAASGFYAHQLLQRAHLPYEFVGDRLERHRMVICPSVGHVSLEDQQRLERYVEQGGVLLYSAGDLLHGFGGEELFGVRVADFTLRSEEVSDFDWEGTHYPLTRESGQLAVLEAVTATVLAAFKNGSPALTRNRYGRGAAYYLNAPLERLLNAPYRLEEAPWHQLYASVAAAEGIEPPVRADAPEVEVTLLGRGEERRAVLINHAPHELTVRLRHPGADSGPGLRLALAAKAVRVLPWSAAEGITAGDEEVI